MGLLALNKKLEAAETSAEEREVRRKIILEKAEGVLGRLREAVSLPGVPGSPGGPGAVASAARDTAELIYVEGWGDLGVHTIAQKSSGVGAEKLYELLDEIEDEQLREATDGLPGYIRVTHHPGEAVIRLDSEELAQINALGTSRWKVRHGHDKKVVSDPKEAVEQAAEWLGRVM